jgi:hypothetical protein
MTATACVPISPLDDADAVCVNHQGDSHVPVALSDDVQLQAVYEWFAVRPAAALVGGAVESAIAYVLDGARTGRFDLNDPAVDSDERRTVGTKLQYHVLEAFELPRLRQPDTEIAGVPVDIKATVCDNWMIPKEGQCKICLLIKIDPAGHQHCSWLMRTHRLWLHGGNGNGDKKRGIRREPLRKWALPLYDLADFRPSPLLLLDQPGRAAVFDPTAGQERRLAELFRRLPGVVLPRSAIETVGFGRRDPLRRARAVKTPLAHEGLEILCGTWRSEFDRAESYGYDLSDDAWLCLDHRP